MGKECDIYCRFCRQWEPQDYRAYIDGLAGYPDLFCLNNPELTFWGWIRKTLGFRIAPAEEMNRG